MAHAVIFDFGISAQRLSDAAAVSEPWEGEGVPALPTQAQQACLDKVTEIAGCINDESFTRLDVITWAGELEELNRAATE